MEAYLCCPTVYGRSLLHTVRFYNDTYSVYIEEMNVRTLFLVAPLGNMNAENSFILFIAVGESDTQ